MLFHLWLDCERDNPTSGWFKKNSQIKISWFLLYIFLYEHIDEESALFQIMDWYKIGNKPLSKLAMTQLSNTK